MAQCCTVNRKQFIISLCIAIIIMLVYAVISSYTADFIAINGTFQNYNAIRRILNGQIPFIDFIPYLGSGPVYLTSLFTLLGGGSFGSSITACNILTNLIYPMIIYQISHYYFRYNGVIPLFILVTIIYSNYFDNITLSSMMTSGISLRGVRGMILPVSMLLCSAWISIIKNKFQQHPFKDSFIQLTLSIIAGFAFCWSNDYGVCVWLSLCLIVPFITLIRSNSVIKTLSSCIIMTVGSTLSIIITAVIYSKGHFSAWLKGNFDFSDYMQWYYNIPTNKVYYIFSLDITPITLTAAVLLIFYIFKIIHNKASDYAIIRYGCPSFWLLASLGAAQEYHLFSGGGVPLHEMLYLITYILIMFEIINLCLWFYRRSPKKLSHYSKFKNINTIYCVSVYFTMLTIAAGALFVEISRNYTNHAVYVSELGGKFKYCYQDIIRTKSFLQQYPGVIFSAYASAAEVLSDQFQPSGIDYIIHVLSDNARSSYMQKLEESHPKYITTIREDYIAGKWIRNANWFFYRKIYKDYHIVFRNSYQYFWVKNEQGYENTIVSDSGVSVNVHIINRHQTRITINTPNIKTGIADVKINYSTKILSSISSKFLINSVVGVYQNYSEELLNMYLFKNDRFLVKNDRFNIQQIDAWSLRSNSSENIPIEIVNGTGSVLLESYPIDSTELHVHYAKCEYIITKPELYSLKENQENPNN